mgnify:CR=1 FL=1
MEVKLGEIVLSKAGRDKGSFFVVMSIDGDYVQICDGRKRKIDSMKRKKIKHLSLGIGHSDYIEGKLSSGHKVTNSEIRRELDEYSSASYSEGEC